MKLATSSTSHVVTSSDNEIDAVNMQLQEIQARRATEKQKYPEGRIPDRELALRDFEIELTRLLVSFSDQTFASSLQKAVDDDFVTLEEVNTEEEQARRDRAIALSISEGDFETENVEYAGAIDRDGENKSVYEKLSTISAVIGYKGGNYTGISASSSQQHHKGVKNSSWPFVDCVACQDSFPLSELIFCPCDDTYCVECLKSLFVRSIKDETLFPPRCCGMRIPLSAIEDKLSDKELANFGAATVEFTTPDRTYCARIDCGRFVPPDSAHAGHAVCPACNTETCTYCKRLSHGGDCPEDKELLAVLALAEGKSWRRCFKCKTMVELNTGCNHITCKCAAEFCYSCGVQWKQCACDVWEERNLLNRAEQVVDREADRPIVPPERARRVVEMRRELRANHECKHPGWWEKQMGSSREGFKCEICNKRHWKYILRCPRCHLLACEECRRHRI